MVCLLPPRSESPTAPKIIKSRAWGPWGAAARRRRRQGKSMLHKQRCLRSQPRTSIGQSILYLWDFWLHTHFAYCLLILMSATLRHLPSWHTDAMAADKITRGTKQKPNAVAPQKSIFQSNHELHSTEYTRKTCLIWDSKSVVSS